jgi:hypothetical protein
MRNVRRVVVTVVAVVAGAGLTAVYVATRYEARIGLMVRETLAQRDHTNDLLRDPATRLMDLRGRPPASGRVVWNEARGGLLLVSGLAPAPVGKTYEAWTMAAGTARPAGVFDVDMRGRASHALAVTGGAVDAFTVTLEPDGGGRAPTGPTVLASP